MAPIFNLPGNLPKYTKLRVDPRAMSGPTPSGSGSGSGSASTPLLSILNVVVDHVMMPPSPMEPMEFREMCRWNQPTTCSNMTEEKAALDVHVDATDENVNALSMEYNLTPTAMFNAMNGTDAASCERDKRFEETIQKEVETVETIMGDENGTTESCLPRHSLLMGASSSSANHGSSGSNSKGELSIRVPVVRIFGPVIPGNVEDYVSNSNSNSHLSFDNDADEIRSNQGQMKRRPQIPQSGCLHIHNAYPYLLARPLVAGPDGSLHHGKYAPVRNSGRIDWDDVSSVQNILEDVHLRLEMALRSSVESHSGLFGDGKSKSPSAGNSNVTGGINVGNDRNSKESTTKSNTTKSQSRTQTHTLYIRRVTTVIGRGFYTYSSGPPAPFLRIEYYDPGLRWRVKMILERGLDLNAGCHPDKGQYDYVEDEGVDGDEEFGSHRNGDGGSDDGRAGGFHDMHQIGRARGDDSDDDDDDAVKPLKFRCYEAHIPYTMQVFKDYNMAGMKYIKVGEVRFRNPLPRGLRKRTKDDFAASSNTTIAFNSSGGEHGNFFFSDTVSSNLLWPKYDDVMTSRNDADGIDENYISLPIDQHWLKKQTSCDLEFDTTVQKLLNVLDVLTELPSPLEERQKIHWRAVPSLREIWEQERKRMAVLLPPENDFLSFKEEDAAECGRDDDDNDDDEKDESDSSDNELSNQKRPVLETKELKTPPFTLNVKKNASVPGTRLAVKGMKRLFRLSQGLENDYRRAMKDIALRHHDFLEEVDGKLRDASRYESNSHRMRPQNHRGSLSIDEDFSCSPSLDAGIEALAALGDQFSQCADEDDVLQFDGLSSQTSERNHSSECSTSLTPIARNVSSLQKFSCTPLSQKEVDEEKEMLKFGLSVDTDDVVQSAVQGIDGIEHSALNLLFDSDDLIEEENDDFLNEEDRMGEEGLERTLSILATQAVETQTIIGGPDAERQDDPETEIKYYHTQNFSGLHDNINLSDNEDDDENSYSDNDEVFKDMPFSIINDGHCGLSFVTQLENNHNSQSSYYDLKLATPNSIQNDCGRNSLSFNCREYSPLQVPQGDFVVELKKKSSLLCGSITNLSQESATMQKKWHPLPDEVLTTTPHWFKYRWDYSNAEQVVYEGSFLEPVKRPPSFVHVKSWMKGNKKQSYLFDNQTRRLFQQRNSKEASKLTNSEESPPLDRKRSIRFVNPTDGAHDIFDDSQISTISGNSKQTAQTVLKKTTSRHRKYDCQSQTLAAYTQYSQMEQSPQEGTPDPLAGMAHQGGRIQVAAGGGLKTAINAPSTFTPLTVMSIELHVQCRIATGLKDHKEIAMVPDSSRDAIFAVVYVYGRDPGGGENLEILERGCVLVFVKSKHRGLTNEPISSIKTKMGMDTEILIEKVSNERSLLLRIASIVQLKDPDALVSWDTQSGGLGYLIERGVALGKPINGNDGTVCSATKVDMARLLGRTPKVIALNEFKTQEKEENVIEAFNDVQQDRGDDYHFGGSGLGVEWDDRVGAGAAAASIVSAVIALINMMLCILFAFLR